MATHIWLFVTAWTVAHQAPLSMGFSRQEFCSGLPIPPPGDLPDAGVELTSRMFPALIGRFFTPSTTYRAYHTSSNFTQKHLPKRNKKIRLNREICINVHSSFIQNSIKLETIQMNKQTWKFPAGSVVRTPHFQPRVLSLVGELRSHKPCNVTKKKKKNKQNGVHLLEY